MNTPDTDFLSQENQDYYNQRDQQYIACKYDGGLERVTIELVPNIILEEEEDGFYQWADNYDHWDNNSYIPVEGDETGAPTPLMLTTVFLTSPKLNITGNQRQEL